MRLLISSVSTVVAACADEGTDGEVKKDRGEDRIKNEAWMGGSCLPACAEPPQIAGEEKREESEEEAGYFQPKRAGGVRERLPEGVAESA